MNWTIRISDQALKALKKLDKVDREMILSYLEQRIDGSENPRLYGKPFRGKHLVDLETFTKVAKMIVFPRHTAADSAANLLFYNRPWMCVLTV